MKSHPPADADILRSFHHTPGAAVLAAFPVVVRAGHLRATSRYRIERRTSPGHDLLFCVAGAGVVQMKGRHYRVKSDELVWINGFAPHAHWADPTNPWELLWIRADGAGLEATRELLGANEDPIFCGSFARETRACLEEILELMAGPAFLRETRVPVVFARLVAALRGARQQSLRSGARTVLPEIETVINRMALYPHRRWTAAELAKLAHMSVPRFYRSFRQITGSAPIDWLRRERLNLAKRRLIESDDPIKTVADQAGYQSPYFFSRDFKRVIGQSPTEFRRQERIGIR